MLELMPTQTTNVTVQKCLLDLRKLQTSDLYKFTGSGAQGVVMSVCSLVEALESGASPKFATNPSDFLVDIKCRLANFCRKAVAGKSPNLIGAVAAKAFADAALQAKEPTMPMLEMPTKFSWLLDPADAQNISELRNSLVKKAASLENLDAQLATPVKRKGGPSESSSSASSSSGPGSSTEVARTNEVEAALAMFRKMP